MRCVPSMASGTTGAPLRTAIMPAPGKNSWMASSGWRVPSGNMSSTPPSLRISSARHERLAVARAPVDGEGARGW